MKEFIAILTRIESESASAGVLATLVAIEGSSYRRPGARILASPDGQRLGSISGGCLEEDVMARAAEVWRTGRPELVSYDTSSENDLVWGIGLGCNGTVHVLLERLLPKPAWAEVTRANLTAGRSTELNIRWRGPAEGLGTSLGPAASSAAGVSFFETIHPPPVLNVFGAGDDAQPLVRLAKELGWRVTVADPRPAYATPGRFPTADRIVVAPIDELVSKVAPAESGLHVVMTHRYVHDVPVLRDLLLGRSSAYLGLLGPRKRAERILEEIARRHPIPAERLKSVRAPVGFNLGANTSEEVALAIVAEIQAAISGADGRPLMNRTSPIHQTPQSGKR